MRESKVIQVVAYGQTVGTLAAGRDYRIAFAYDEEWLEHGFAISPFSLPLKKEVFFPRSYDPFEGLFGVFADSLPDGWGRLLVDRMMQRNGLALSEITNLYRLAVVGNSGMGALEYIPAIELAAEIEGIDFDELAQSCKDLLQGEDSKDIDTLFALGGSSGGARPKIFQKIDDEDWIIKFPSTYDQSGIGKMEYDYACCAQKCGIEMSETRLLPSKYHEGYFATKRFDRRKKKKIHMVSVSGLLETTHRIPNLDYHILMQLTLKLTKSYLQVEKMFRLMCFNIFAHNRDDHSKNFSFLYEKEENQWRLAPAYDLTYSYSIGGEHATTINGQGKNPSASDILEVAGKAKLDMAKAKEIMREVEAIVKHDLEKYIRAD
ncbi:type II toxin-antitoxin system HipA family toxin [Clostridiales bacterium COT073_COT-073]|nr:type II toxin-antitoxin system HipA family toxin [Clostridiales bacterium COT073_COT-073]